MKAKYEEKFIVINKKIFEEINSSNGNNPKNIFDEDFLSVKLFKIALENLVDDYERRMKKPLLNKYYVCNQDEPYAKKVIDIILKGEAEKQK
jgi:hypothetical protein